MASRGNKTQNTNAYGNRSAMPYSRANLPPIVPSGPRRTGGASLQQQEYERQTLERKRAAVNKRKSYYRDDRRKKGKKDPNSVYRKEKQKRIKKGRDHFFVMRKFVCFLMFLLFAVCIALFVMGYLNMFPEYTSMYTQPDYTLKEERVQKEVDGVVVDYEDKSQHFTTVDPIFGFLKTIPFIGDIGPSPKYTDMATKAEGANTDMIASIVLKYFPIAILLFIIIALINMIKAFLGMFGSRVYRMFGLSAILMIIMAAVAALAGMALNLPTEQAALDYAKIVPFFTNYLLKPSDGGTNAAGFGLLAMVAIPVIILILSLFAKKKVPFSIFD